MKKNAGGIVETVGIRSKALGILKQYRIYLPHAYATSRMSYPVLYLFRGHEREWTNPYEDTTRGGRSIVDTLDELIASRAITPMLVVMPGLSSQDNSIPGLGVDMRAPELARHKKGIGTGRFACYFINDLIPHVERRFRAVPRRSQRAVDGFSLGGWTAMLCAARNPHLFVSAGCYDGTHMWRALLDPRPETKGIDAAWMTPELFDPVFGRPRDVEFMKNWNPTDIIATARGESLRYLKSMSFHVQSAAFDGQKGNIDRAEHFVDVLKKIGISNSFPTVVLARNAVHSWRFADMHMRQTLPRHALAFRSGD